MGCFNFPTLNVWEFETLPTPKFAKSMAILPHRKTHNEISQALLVPNIYIGSNSKFDGCNKKNTKSHKKALKTDWVLVGWRFVEA